MQQVEFQALQLLPAAVQPPGSHGVSRGGRRPSPHAFVEDRTRVCPRIPSLLLRLQKIIDLSLISGPAGKRPSAHADQMQLPCRLISIPEASRQRADLLLAGRFLESLCQSVDHQKPSEQFSASKRRGPLKILLILRRGFPKPGLQRRKPGPVADDRQPLQALGHLRRLSGKPGTDLMADRPADAAAGTVNLLHIPCLLRFLQHLQILPCDPPFLHLIGQHRLRLVRAQFPAMAGAGGIVKRLQKLYHRLIPGNHHRHDGAFLDHRAFPCAQTLQKLLVTLSPAGTFQTFCGNTQNLLQKLRLFLCMIFICCMQFLFVLRFLRGNAAVLRPAILRPVL